MFPAASKRMALAPPSPGLPTIGPGTSTAVDLRVRHEDPSVVAGAKGCGAVGEDRPGVARAGDGEAAIGDDAGAKTLGQPHAVRVGWAERTVGAPAAARGRRQRVLPEGEAQRDPAGGDQPRAYELSPRLHRGSTVRIGARGGVSSRDGSSGG